MTEGQTTPRSSGTPAPVAGGEFFSKEELADVARFDFKDRSLEIPELGDKKLGLHALPVAERHSLMKQLPNKAADWQLKHTALSLSKYIVQPQLSADEWLELIKPWPSPALDRINREMAKIMGSGEEEEAAAAAEFRESE